MLEYRCGADETRVFVYEEVILCYIIPRYFCGSAFLIRTMPDSANRSVTTALMLGDGLQFVTLLTLLLSCALLLTLSMVYNRSLNNCTIDVLHRLFVNKELMETLAR